MKKDSVFQSRIGFLSVATLLLALGVTPYAVADTSWTGTAGDNQYATVANWSNGIPASGNPGSVNTTVSVTDAVILEAGTMLTIENGGNLTIGGMTQFQGNKDNVATFNVETGGTLHSNNYFLLGQGGNQYGVLNINGGTANINSNSFTIGDNGHGTVNLNSDTLKVAPVMEIGNHSTSTGTVNMYGGTLNAGNIRVGGGDSNDTDKRVQTNTGNFNYYGGEFKSTNLIYVGYGHGATGIFTVKSGADLTLDAPIRLAARDREDNTTTGKLILEAGTAENPTTMNHSAKVSVGYVDVGLLEVNANAAYTNTETVTLGVQATGKGTLHIKSNGTGTFNNLNVASFTGGTSTINVDAAGSATITTLTVGTETGSETGKVSINVADGGTLATQYAVFSNGNSEVNLSGAMNVGLNLFVRGNTNLTGTGTMTFNTADNGYVGHETDGVLTVSDSAKFNMTGGNQLFLGYWKKGTLNYNSSAESTWTNTVRIGTGAEGLLSVTSGKITHSTGYFIVGNDNVGTLAISGTAKVKANNLYIGDQYKTSGVKGVILVKDSGELSSNVIYLADKTNSVGELTVQDSAVVSTGQFRLGRSQHYNDADTSHTSYLGGGDATATINGGSFSCSQLVMGNQKAPCTLNVLAGTFKTTGAEASSVVGNSQINLAGGNKTTVTLAGSLTLEDTSVIKVTDGTKLTGTSLAFTDNSSLELDGLISSRHFPDRSLSQMTQV